jgi:hypothetical protein
VNGDEAHIDDGYSGQRRLPDDREVAVANPIHVTTERQLTDSLQTGTTPLWNGRTGRGAVIAESDLDRRVLADSSPRVKRWHWRFAALITSSRLVELGTELPRTLRAVRGALNKERLPKNCCRQLRAAFSTPVRLLSGHSHLLHRVRTGIIRRLTVQCLADSLVRDRRMV